MGWRVVKGVEVVAVGIEERERGMISAGMWSKPPTQGLELTVRIEFLYYFFYAATIRSNAAELL